MSFINKFKEFKNNIAFINEKNEKITYKKFINDIKSFNKFKIKNKSIVFLLSSTTYSFNVIYFNFLIEGIVPFVLNENLDIEKIQKLSRIYKPNFILSVKKNDIQNFRQTSNFNEYYIYKNRDQFNHKFTKDLALLVSTSGSTGDVKFVKLSLENIYTNTKSICNYLNIKKNHVSISNLPFSYSFGLSILHTHLYSGAKIIICKHSIIEKKFWDIFKLYRVNSFNGVPYSYEILNKIKFFDKEYKHLKYFTVAGGSININLLKFIINYLKKNKKKFYNMYGQAEASTRISFLPTNKLEKKIGSIGVAIPSGKIYLIDKSNKIIKKPFTTGELIYKGKNVMIGYSSSLKDLNVKRQNKYILKTGDIGFFDEEKYFFITSRKKRIIKIYGHRVSLDEIQKMLELNGIKNVCIAKEERLKIFLLKEFNQDKINKLISIYTKINVKSITILKVIKSFPTTTNGKIDFPRLYNEEF